MLTFYFYEMTKIAFTWFKRGYQISSHLPSDHYLLRPSLSLPTHAAPQISSSASGPKFLLLHPEGSPCASISHFLLRVQAMPLISSEAKVLSHLPNGLSRLFSLLKLSVSFRLRMLVYWEHPLHSP